MIRCWAVRADRAISAAGSPQTSRYARRDQRRGADHRRTARPRGGDGSLRHRLRRQSLTGTGSWKTYAIELNLRKGGTTHPFLTLQFLTDGRYDWRSGLFLTVDGREKHLVATDHLESPSLACSTLDDLFDIVARHRLHFDQARQTGVVFHMMSCLTEHGRVGLTAVGNSAAEADTLYRRAERILLDEARTASTPL